MATARDVIKRSLRLIGAIASSETPSGAEMADALSTLNAMLDSWSTENLIIYSKTTEKFQLVTGTNTYTIGPGGDFDTTRPIELISAAIEDQSASPSVEYCVDILTFEEWADIRVKNLDGLPTKLFYNPESPLGVITLWPKPDTADKLVLYSLKPLGGFANASDDVELPPGYELALSYNLAVLIAPEYNKAASVDVVNSALNLKANIKRKNVKPLFLTCDLPTSQRKYSFDYRVGE